MAANSVKKTIPNGIFCSEIWLSSAPTVRAPSDGVNTQMVTSEAASVNGDEIPARLVQQAWQDRQSELQQQIRDELPPELVRAEQQKLLDGFIDREVMVQRARESGYHVSDRELAVVTSKGPKSERETWRRIDHGDPKYPKCVPVK